MENEKMRKREKKKVCLQYCTGYNSNFQGVAIYNCSWPNIHTNTSCNSWQGSILGFLFSVFFFFFFLFYFFLLKQEFLMCARQVKKGTYRFLRRINRP